MLIDVNMARLNGVAATRRIRTLLSYTVLVGMSCLSRQMVERAMLSAWADAFPADGKIIPCYVTLSLQPSYKGDVLMKILVFVSIATLSFSALVWADSYDDRKQRQRDTDKAYENRLQRQRDDTRAYDRRQQHQRDDKRAYENRQQRLRENDKAYEKSQQRRSDDDKSDENRQPENP